MRPAAGENLAALFSIEEFGLGRLPLPAGPFSFMHGEMTGAQKRLSYSPLSVP